MDIFIYRNKPLTIVHDLINIIKIYPMGSVDKYKNNKVYHISFNITLSWEHTEVILQFAGLFCEI